MILTNCAILGIPNLSGGAPGSNFDTIFIGHARNWPLFEPFPRHSGDQPTLD